MAAFRYLGPKAKVHGRAGMNIFKTCGDEPDPLPPPFPVGARVRYMGNQEVSRAGAKLKAPGLIVTISEVKAGEHACPGGPIRTRHGCSIYEVEGNRRAIYADAAKDWEIVLPENHAR